MLTRRLRNLQRIRVSDMIDPRLNSVHLEAPRREQYRRAREELLQARGVHTVALEQEEDHEVLCNCPNTFIDNPDLAPPGLEFWLADKTGIYPLRTGINTVGRAHDNDVVLENAFISRRHCAILVHADHSCELHDTASKNGTYLNGQKLSGPTRLKCGDEIRMCDLSLVFVARTSPVEQLAPVVTLQKDNSQ